MFQILSISSILPQIINIESLFESYVINNDRKIHVDNINLLYYRKSILDRFNQMIHCGNARKRAKGNICMRLTKAEFREKDNHLKFLSSLNDISRVQNYSHDDDNSYDIPDLMSDDSDDDESDVSTSDLPGLISDSDTESDSDSSPICSRQFFFNRNKGTGSQNFSSSLNEEYEQFRSRELNKSLRSFMNQEKVAFGGPPLKPIPSGIQDRSSVRIWMKDIEQYLRYRCAASSNYEHITLGRFLTSKALDTANLSLANLKLRQDSYVSPDSYLQAYAEAETKVHECILSLEDIRINMYNLIHQQISPASIKVIESRHKDEYKASQNDKDPQTLYHLALLTHFFDRMMPRALHAHQLNVVTNYKMPDKGQVINEYNEAIMQNYELLAYTYELAYSKPISAIAAAAANTPEVQPASISGISGISWTISTVDSCVLRHAYISSLNADFFLMSDNKGSYDDINNLVLFGTMQQLHEYVANWYDVETARYLGTYANLRDRNPPGAIKSTIKTPSVAFSAESNAADSASSQRSLTPSRPSHRDKSYSRSRARSNSAGSRSSFQSHSSKGSHSGRSTGSSGSSHHSSNLRRQSDFNRNRQKSHHGSNHRYTQRFESKHCDYCTLIGFSNAKNHDTVDCNVLKQHTSARSVDPRWSPLRSTQLSRRSDHSRKSSISTHSSSRKSSASPSSHSSSRDHRSSNRPKYTSSRANFVSSSDIDELLSIEGVCLMNTQKSFDTPSPFQQVSTVSPFDNYLGDEIPKPFTSSSQSSTMSQRKYRQQPAKKMYSPFKTNLQPPQYEPPTSPYHIPHSVRYPLCEELKNYLLSCPSPTQFKRQIYQALHLIEDGLKVLNSIEATDDSLDSLLPRILIQNIEHGISNAVQQHSQYIAVFEQPCTHYVADQHDQANSISGIVTTPSFSFSTRQMISSPSFHTASIILDTGSTHHLFSLHLARIFHVQLLSLEQPHEFKGVGGSIMATHFGHFAGFTHILFAELEHDTNLLSSSLLTRYGYILEFVHEGIRVYHPDHLNPEGILFLRKGGLYVYEYVREPDDNTSDSSDEDNDDDSASSTTSHDISFACSASELRHAEAYHQWHVSTGCRGLSEELSQLRRGSIQNSPIFSPTDIKKAREILGPCKICVLAKSRNPSAPPRDIREKTKVIGITQHIDIFFIRNPVSKDLIPNFIFVDEATNNIFLWNGKDRTKNSFKEALAQCTGYYLKFKHKHPQNLISDGEGAVAAYETEFASVGGQITFTARGQHVGLAECYIGKIKTIMRTILFSLGHKWPSIWITFLIKEAEQLFRLRSTTKSDGVPLCELIEHRRADYSRMQVPFGSYVLATEPIDTLDSMEPRAVEGIVVSRPLHGSLTYIIYNLTTKSFMRRRKVQLMAKPNAIIELLHSMTIASSTIASQIHDIVLGGPPDSDIRDTHIASGEQDHIEDHIPLHIGPDPIPLPEIVYLHANMRPGRPKKSNPDISPRSSRTTSGEHCNVEDAASTSMHTPPSPLQCSPDEPIEALHLPEIDAPDASNTVTDPPNIPDPNIASNTVTDPPNIPDPNIGPAVEKIRQPVPNSAKIKNFQQDKVEPPLPTRQSTRIRKIPDKLLSSYAAKSTDNINLRRASIMDFDKSTAASKKEFQQLLDKDIFRPVFRSDLTGVQASKNISGFTFLKKKFHVDGSLDKWKARFVAGGHQVDAAALGPLYSYTVQLSTLFTLFSLAAQFNWSISNSDVTAAYLNTRLPKEQQIPMILGKEETSIVISIKPEWKRYVRENNTMQVLILGGLYGLPQSALLWYNRLISVFMDLGYFASDVDKACFIKFDNKSISVIVIHVDDIIHFYIMKNVDNLLQKTLTQHFGTLTTNHTDKGIYLGIEYTFNRADRSVFLTMSKYTNKLISDFNVQRARPAPCSDSFITINDESPRCDQHSFASIVMTIYYMAMRTRPDLQVYCSFLATRIHNCNEQDLRKVNHLLSYILHTKERGITFRTRGTRLHFSMDASYNIHQNNRSHSGLHVTLGGDEFPQDGQGGPLLVLSHIQKLTASSSCEAEIIAVFVYHQLILSMRALLSNLGFNQADKPSIIYQDNQSTILLFTRGNNDRGSTRHLQMRISRMFELHEDGIVHFQYCNTDAMPADAPSKPLHAKADMYKLTRLCNSTL